MFVTLLRDFPRLGKKTERVQVSDAYARNVLIPQNIATIGEQSAYRLPKPQQYSPIDHEKTLELLKEPFLLKRALNEKGGLYEKVTGRDIAHLVSQRIGAPEHAIKVDLPEPIASAGTTSIVSHIASKHYSITVTVQS